MIVLTGHGTLAEAYRKVNPECYIHSFRSMEDNDIRQIFKNTEILIHNSAGQKEEDSTSNIALTKRIVYLLLSTNRKIKFVNIGSMSYLNCSGYLSIDKMSAYAYSKFLSEIYCLASLSQMKSVRFSTLFYRDPEKDILSKLINDAVFRQEMKLINGGINKRDFLSIDIAAKELHRIIMTKTEPIITIASGVESTFIHAAKIIQKMTAAKIDFTIGSVKPVMSKFQKTVEVNIYDEIKSYINQLKSA